MFHDDLIEKLLVTIEERRQVDVLVEFVRHALNVCDHSIHLFFLAEYNRGKKAMYAQ